MFIPSSSNDSFLQLLCFEPIVSLSTKVFFFHLNFHNSRKKKKKGNFETSNYFIRHKNGTLASSCLSEVEPPPFLCKKNWRTMLKFYPFLANQSMIILERKKKRLLTDFLGEIELWLWYCSWEEKQNTLFSSIVCMCWKMRKVWSFYHAKAMAIKILSLSLSVFISNNRQKICQKSEKTLPLNSISWFHRDQRRKIKKKRKEEEEPFLWVEIDFVVMMVLFSKHHLQILIEDVEDEEDDDDDFDQIILDLKNTFFYLLVIQIPFLILFCLWEYCLY